MSSPNVILITPDQFQATALGCAGNPVVRTPHLDQLAARSTRFSECHVHNWVCTPSRATLVTGAHPSVHGALFNDMRADLELQSVAGLFQKAGYRTGHVGKWHLKPSGADFGFETILAQHGYPTYLAAHGLDPDLGDEYQADWTRQFSTWISPVPAEHYITTYETDQAIGYIEAEQDRPFFLWLSYEKPHPPYNPPAEYAEMYDPDTVPLPPAWEQLASSEVRPKIDDSHGHWRTSVPPADMTDADIRQTIAYYYASISFLDENIGRLIAALTEQGQLENTIIVFTSDHGEMMGQHHLLNKGPYPYDALTRVPFLMCDPRRGEAGQVRSDLVGQEDLVATLISSAGLRPAEHMLGRDLLAQDTAPSAGSATGVSGHHYGPYYEVVVRTWRSPDFRYNVYSYRTGEVVEELYDLVDDPHETTNLAGAAERRETLESMREALLRDIVRHDHAHSDIIETRLKFTSAETRQVHGGW